MKHWDTFYRDHWRLKRWIKATDDIDQSGLLPQDSEYYDKLHDKIMSRLDEPLQETMAASVDDTRSASKKAALLSKSHSNMQAKAQSKDLAETQPKARRGRKWGTAILGTITLSIMLVLLTWYSYKKLPMAFKKVEVIPTANR